MGFGFRVLYQPEARKLLWLMGLTVAVVFGFQYIHDNVWTALFSSHRMLNGTFTPAGPPLDSALKGVASNSSYSVDATFLGTGSGTEASSKGNATEHGYEMAGLGSKSNDEFVSAKNKSLSSNFGSINNVASLKNHSVINQAVAQTADSVVNIGFPAKASAPQSSISEISYAFSVSPSGGNDTHLKATVNESSNAWPPSIALPPENPLLNSSISKPYVNTSDSRSAPKDKMDKLSEGRPYMQLQSRSGSVKDNFSSFSVTSSPRVREKRKNRKRAVPISEMNNLLRQSHTSLNSTRPRWGSAADQEMLYAKSHIVNAPIVRKDKALYSPVYRNMSMFKRSYKLMESLLKVYIYKEGDKPVFHQPEGILSGIYASEAWFMKQMEANKHFVTKDPRKAHLFYLPFSSRQLELAVYVRNSHRRNNLIQYLKNYVSMISAKYPFWNRTGGADHFLAGCHDWATDETRGAMLNCIRALCNSDINAGFSIGKDVSLPETYVRSPKNPLKSVGGNSPSRRPILAFFAGQLHGYVRPTLLEYWQNKDPDMKIFGPMPRLEANMSYIQHMKSSKYCICAKGYEVNSPRIVEAISYECVPVVISDNYVPPFFEVLEWESFAVFVLEKDIPNLKNILLSIPEKRYMEMQKRVRKVQKHFLWHSEPVKYDIFHMILHSVWFNRLFQMHPTT